MKKDLHPSNYRLVVFKDMSNDYAFLTRSCVETKETITWEDGNEYPLVKLEISHTSHPFYTGKMKLVDTDLSYRTNSVAVTTRSNYNLTIIYGNPDSFIGIFVF
nr:type B 50S ribosomal protein L31 [Sphingobacterium sp. T2]